MARLAQLAVLCIATTLPGCGGGQPDRDVSSTQSVVEADTGDALSAGTAHVPGTTDRVPREVTRTCERAAAKVTIQMLCPKIVPQGRIERALGFGPITLSSEPRYYELTFNNASQRHWIVGRGGPREVSKFVLGSKPRYQLIRRDTIDGRRTSTYAFAGPPGALHSSHIAIFSNYRGTVVFAIVHGHERRRVALSVLRSMLP